MFAGISGAMTLIACGLVLVAAGRAGCAERGIRVRTLGRVRVVAALLVLTAAAVFCGYQLEVLHDTCRRGLLIPHRPGLAVYGEQLDQLLALHGVLITALTFAALAASRRCTAAHQPIDRVAGVIGLIALATAGAVMASTYPASIYSRIVRVYAFLIFLVGLPATLLLLVASLFLLGRRKLSDADADLEYPLCLACGYNLTGNTSGCCPECGCLIPEATKRGLPSPQVSAEGQSRWPRGIILTCYAFAVLLIRGPILKCIADLSGVVLPLPQWPYALPSYSQCMFVPHFDVIRPNIVLAAVLFIGAYGLGRHRRWGVWVCYAWTAIVIGLTMMDSIRAGSGMVYLVSPGVHSDVIGLWFAFLRGVIGAGFPIFLALWLSQRHVRHRVASWGH